ncbi:MAG: hypothetical protein ACI8ZF_000716 [Candidatus Midichloriaceae bacterium]|jgi:hypothetical protein
MLNSVAYYKETSHIPLFHEDKIYFAIRSYLYKSEHYFLAVNAKTFEIKSIKQAVAFYRKSDKKGRYFFLKK